MFQNSLLFISIWTESSALNAFSSNQVFYYSILQPFNLNWATFCSQIHCLCDLTSAPWLSHLEWSPATSSRIPSTTSFQEYLVGAVMYKTLYLTGSIRWIDSRWDPTKLEVCVLSPSECEVSSGQGPYCVSYFSASSKALTKVMFVWEGRVSKQFRGWDDVHQKGHRCDVEGGVVYWGIIGLQGEDSFTFQILSIVVPHC